jgi:hypothetical protein
MVPSEPNMSALRGTRFPQASHDIITHMAASPLIRSIDATHIPRCNKGTMYINVGCGTTVVVICSLFQDAHQQPITFPLKL